MRCVLTPRTSCPIPFTSINGQFGKVSVGVTSSLKVSWNILPQKRQGSKYGYLWRFKTFRVVILLRRTPAIRIPQVNCNGAVNEFDLTAVNIQTQYSHETTYVTVVQYIISVGVPEAT
jgi:hypothetical protein